MGRLWRGELPLSEAFWTHAIILVAVLNMVATAAALGLLAAGLHPAAAVAIYIAPFPYVVAAVVGVWRSADRQAATPTIATLARWSAAAWGILMALL